jgi:hypothetical protein
MANIPVGQKQNRQAKTDSIKQSGGSCWIIMLAVCG